MMSKKWKLKNFKMNIPIISINKLDFPDNDVPKKIGLACEEFGFFAIKNHGINKRLIQDSLILSKKIFRLPFKDKIQYHQNDGAGQRGYTPFGIEKAVNAEVSDQKEFWHQGRANWDKKYKSIMPPNEAVVSIEHFDEKLDRLYIELDNLGKKILSYISVFLQLDPDWFDNKINQGNSILRLIHYPPINKNIQGIRAAPHEDINLITLMLGTQQEGLEVLDKSNNWIPIETNPNIIVCNVGDMLQRLTNKRLKSTTHRVINPMNSNKNLSRYSMPFFVHLNPDFLIKTLPQCIDNEHPDTYPESILANDYLNMRLKEINLK
jgi:isopenicillin N synthase-like dioxygenase